VTRRTASLWLIGLYACLLNLVASCPTHGQEIVGVTSFEEHNGGEYRFDVDLPEGHRAITFWRVPERLWWRQYGDTVVVTGPPGRYTIRVDAILGSTFEDARPVSAALPVEIVGVTPRPPAPGPGPTPPPTPAPEPTPEFGPLSRILILYESSRKTGREVYLDPMVRDTMTELAAKEPIASGMVRPLWRIWDQDLSPQFEPGWSLLLEWAKLQPEFRTLPAAFLFDERGRGVAFTLPERPEEMIATLNQYAGR
jgi:hypothetical protein